MNDKQALYAEIRPDIQEVSSRLFDLSKVFIHNQGDFLPHAAVLTAESKVEFVGTMDEKDLTNAAEILPLLHAGLRDLAKRKQLFAIGIAESVTITPADRATTKAIKVLLEHRRGITVALYLPYEKRLIKGYIFHDVFSVVAKSEVSAW